MSILLQLFWSFFQIGALSIGGGYAAMPLIQNQVVQLHPWLTMEEFADIVTIAEMTPGPIAINSATFVGIQVAGIQGALIATFGCVLPSCCIVLLLGKLYFRYQNLQVVQGVLDGLRPAIVAMIASAGLSILWTALFGGDPFKIGVEGFNIFSGILCVGAFVVLRKWKLNPIAVMSICGGISLIGYWVAGISA